MKKAILLLLLFALPAWAADQESRCPLGPEKALKVHLVLRDGALRLRTTDSELYHLRYDSKGTAPKILYRPGSLELSTSPTHLPVPPTFSLLLTQKRPISLQAKLGKQGDLDLGGLRLSQVDLDTGFSKTRLAFSQLNPIPLKRFTLKAGPADLQVTGLGNSNFEHLIFNGGAGRYLLDFGGTYRRKGFVKLNLGIGQATIVVPKKVGIRLSTNGSLFSNVSLPDFFLGGEETSPNYETAEGTLDFDIHCGLGSSLQVLWK